MNKEIDFSYLHQECKQLIATPEGRKKFGLSKHGSILKQQLLDFYGNLFDTHGERFYAAAYGLTERPLCATCGSKTRLYNLTAGFSRFCSTACSWKNQETLDRRRNTQHIKYGVDSHTQTDEWKQKNSARMKANSSQIQAKRKSTLLSKHQSIEAAYSSIWEKSRSTMLTKYGVDNAARLPESPSAANRRLAYIELLRKKIPEIERSFDVKALWDPENYYNIPWGEYLWEHKCGHQFISHFNYAKIKPRCPACRPRSQHEALVATWLSDADIEFKKNDRKAIAPLELDFLIDTIAVEVNGWYWHRELANRTPLGIKSEHALTKGIRLLHFWDWEIEQKPQICRSILFNALGRSKRIYARACTVGYINLKEARQFCEEHHIAGAAGGQIAVGLFYENEPVMVLIMGRPRFSKHADWEIVRSCSRLSTSVIGGLSRLLRFFRQYNPGSIITYSDNRLFDGASYTQLGFKQISKNAPSYVWVKGNSVLSRYQTQKHRLKALLGEKYNPTLSESENMVQQGWSRVFDAGTTTWILNDKIM